MLAGKEYGSGSSRDWAAKGTALLGVKAVIAESYERIHRSNLIGMGVLPLQFPEGETAESLGLTGEETFSITGVTELNDGTTPRTVKVTRRRRRVRRRGAHRHPGRGELLPQRRDHAVRAAQPAQQLSRGVLLGEPLLVLAVVALALLVGAVTQNVVGLGLGLVAAPVVTLVAPALMPELMLWLACPCRWSRCRASATTSTGAAWAGRCRPALVGTVVGVVAVATHARPAASASWSA